MTKQEREDALALLMAGKLYIEEFGWLQGNIGGTFPVPPFSGSLAYQPCCAVGAIYSGGAWFASDCGDGYLLARAVLDSTVRGGIVEFNDTKGRTKAQVLRKFDEAIALLESEK